MYGSCGVTSGVCLTAASVLPSGMSGSEIARVLLEVAGAGFGLYAATGFMVLLAATVLRLRRRATRPRSGPDAGAPTVHRGAPW